MENSPPEYLLIGSAARQAFSADTFCLGLSYLHLLTGHAPYEELLADVKCPEYLKNQLESLWETQDQSSDYYVIHEVVDSLDDSEEVDIDAIDSCKNVLYHTIYRYMVLLHGCEFFSHEKSDTKSQFSTSPVWNVLVDALALDGDDSKPVSKRSPRRAACRNQYIKDYELWSIKSGNHVIMTKTRQRLATLGEEAERVLFAMLHFDPSKR